MGVEIVPATTSAPAHRWKPYPAYKDSGVEWLGEVPEHWEVKKLKFADEVIMGQSPNSEDYNKNGQGLPFLQGNAEFGDLNPIPIIWCETANKTATFGDVLLSVRAPVGAVNLADQKYGIGRGLCAIRAIKSNNRYLFYVCICLNDELNSIGTGSTYAAISVDDVKNVKYPFPMVEEQLSIASFLDRQTVHLDALISKKERLIALLEEKRAALISRTVAKGLDPNAPMKDSGVEWLGEVPEHWEVKRLKYIAPVSNKKLTEKPEELLYLGLEQVESKTGHLLLDVMVENVESVVNVFNKGDVLFGKLRPYLAKVVYADFQGVCTSELLVLNPYPSLDGKCLFYRLISDDFINLINSMTYGTKMPRASSEQISNTSVPLPPLPEQRAIASFLDRETARIDALISKVREGIEKLREYRTALISAAVTGKIDVREVF